MKVEIRQTPEAAEPYAVICCREADASVLAAAEVLRGGSDFITASDGERIVVIRRKELFMIRTEEGRTRLYTLSPIFWRHFEARNTSICSL